jgi:transcriptional regulator with XRE-family HTH domain
MKNHHDEASGEIIRRAREGRGWTQQDLAEKVGTKQQTIEKIELGKTKHSRFLVKIALELGLEPGTLIPDLVTKSGPPALIPEADIRSNQRDFPVHAAAQGGRGELIVSADPVSWVLRPTPLVGVSRAYGIIVVGESMVPEFWPGDTALINPHLPPTRHETFVFYSEDHGDVRATIKHLIKWTDTVWHLKQWNPEHGEKHDFTLSRAEWPKCHRVVGKYSK